MAITGECFCGEVRYQLDGRLRDAKSCHCSRCRKAFSSQASAYALVERSEFTWLSGEELLTSYVGRHGFGLQFCSKCGSTIYRIFDGVIHGVTLGCVNGDPEIEISMHIFVGSKAAWEVLPDAGAQHYEQVPAVHNNHRHVDVFSIAASRPFKASHAAGVKFFGAPSPTML